MRYASLSVGIIFFITAAVLGAATIEQALDRNGNGFIDDLEMLQALDLWVRQTPVPGTENLTISDQKMIELLQLWIKQVPLGQPPAPPPPPPPPPAAKACPDAPATARVLTVPGEFPTIQQAIQNARDGDKILVRPGTYQGGIVIDKNIILEGQEGAGVTRIVSTSDQKGIVVLRTLGGVIRGFGISGGKAGISLEAASNVCIEQNEIFNNVGPGIELSGKTVELGREAQQVTIVNNVIRNNVGYGIVATELLRGQILANQIMDIAASPDGSAGYGVSVVRGSRVEIRGNSIQRTRSHGLYTAGITELKITENEIRGAPTAPGASPAAGIVVGSGTVGALVTDNTLSENEIGIVIESTRSITVRGNTITRSKVAGVRINASLLVRLEGGTVSDTQPPEPRGAQLGVGVEALNDSTVTVVGVAIQRSFGYGLWVARGAEVEVSQSLIEGTTGRPGVPGRGVGVQDARVRIAESRIARNTDDGIAVLAGGHAELSGNEIIGNGGFGIFAEGAVSCPAANSFSDNGQNRSAGVPAACGG
jgi:F-box protein 11